MHLPSFDIRLSLCWHMSKTCALISYGDKIENFFQRDIRSQLQTATIGLCLLRVLILARNRWEWSRR